MLEEERCAAAILRFSAVGNWNAEMIVTICIFASIRAQGGFMVKTTVNCYQKETFDRNIKMPGDRNKRKGGWKLQRTAKDMTGPNNCSTCLNHLKIF